jgi:hypothetical protein
MTHTPGPWVAVKHPEAGYDIDHVATGHGIVTGSGVEKEEDAHLIAAAPDLLAALEEISELSYGDEGDGASKIAEAAIKKAKGESQDG